MGRSKPLDAREQQWCALAARVARPEGRRIAEVRDALADYGDGTIPPRDAWETLVARGLAEEHWATRGPADVVSMDGRITAASIAAVAGDPEGVARAEALVSELARRLAPWDVQLPRRVQWRTIPVTAPRFPTPDGFAAPVAFACMDALFASLRWTNKDDSALRRSVERAFRPVSGRPSGTVTTANPPLRADDAPWRARFWDGHTSPGQQCIYHVVNRGLWEMAVTLDVVVPDRRSLPVQGRRFAELDDPAEPLLEVWRTGYVIGEVGENSVVLFAPEPPPRT